MFFPGGYIKINYKTNKFVVKNVKNLKIVNEENHSYRKEVVGTGFNEYKDCAEKEFTFSAYVNPYLIPSGETVSQNLELKNFSDGSAETYGYVLNDDMISTITLSTE